jgi:SPP1 gp7 family putative phage head morphogenesis protein
MKALKVKKQILRSRISNARSRNNERQLERELARFFDSLGKQVQSNLEEYWSPHLLQGQINLISKPIMEAQAEYYLILQKYNRREYRLGVREAERLVKLANKPVAEKAIKPRLNKRFDLFTTLRGAEEDLLERVFLASQATLTRVDTSIKLLLTEGYQSGKGINYVANLLIKRFDQLQTWEAQRIARTEIHNSHNTAVMDTYQELGVEYTMWISAGDDGRTRDSHLEVDGEIIPIGGTYSNDLKYPGDTDGPIEEWINCRCSNAPYVIPYGYAAPPMQQFTENDLIKIR